MTRRSFVALVPILVLALVVRLIAHAAMAEAEATFHPLIDSEAYLLQALRVAAGEDLTDGVYFQAPLYAALLGGVLGLCGVPGVVEATSTAEVPPAVLAQALAVGRGLNLVLGLLAVILVWQLGRRLFDERSGLAAGALAALYGPAMFYEAHLLKVSLSLLILPAAALAGAWAWERGRASGFVFPGVVLGLGALVRGNLQVVMVLSVLALLLFAWKQGRGRWGLLAAAALVGGVLLALSPVILRNSLVVGRVTLSTAAPGTAFYLCNHGGNETGLVQHTSLNRQVPRHEHEDWTRMAEDRTGREMSANEVSWYWATVALGDIAGDPGRWLLAETRKLGMLLSRYESPDNTSLQLGREEVALLAILPGYATLVALAAGGLALVLLGACRGDGAGRASRARVVLLIVGGAYAASLLIFVVTSRFRMPLVVVLMPLAGVFLAHLREAWLPARRVRVAGALLLGALATLASESDWLGPLTERERVGHLASRLHNRAETASRLGNASAARADLERAIAVTESVGVGAPLLYVKVAGWERLSAARARAEGEQHAAVGDLDAARRSGGQVTAHWSRARSLLHDKALRLNPEHGPANRDAGLLAYEMDDLAAAVPFLERALATQAGDRVARQYLVLSLRALGRSAEALSHAEELVRQDSGVDDAWGLLALARIDTGDVPGAAEAVAEYDRRAAQREASGLQRYLPDQPAFEEFRGVP